MISDLALDYEIHVAALPSQVWRGLTDPEMTRQYVYGTRLETNLKKGAAYAFVGDGGFKVVDGEILDIEPFKKLVLSWRAHWDAEAAKDPPSRVTYELTEASSNTTKLRVIHDGFKTATATYNGSVGAWSLMMSSLKSLIETGKPLPSDRS